ncbi:hypothetical protein [Luteimonas sp. MC1825]|uniref:hypothetical protein n=1 Tax=Luteimonas sp. MC1825 TaxID=2761107 RepID=UPI0016206745|nr:hypothetical protein [Luteimonas sp. MC1825]MBB6598647.1 hypothetical protein [Luteimonas sp. MC1825]QOC88822.1 hypothetical protein IDM46_03465 [Luteimonas sp. MC1825]
MLTRPAFDAWRAGWMVAAAVASSLLFIALVHHLPVSILAGAGYDDAWFWQRAESIAAGRWLGTFDSMTLIKGPGYPLFLAASHVLGLPATTMQAVLYAAACLLLGGAVYRVSGRPLLALVLVLAVQWHPAALGWNRVIRDNIGGAQILIVLACLLYFLHARRAGRRGWGWAVSAGIALAWLWTTREDAVWVVPGITLLLLAHAATAWRERVDRRRLAVGVGLMAFACAGALGVVAGVNMARYGAFATVDTRGTAYRDALTALQRVRVGPPVHQVPVPEPVRQAVYATSPAFARLRPYLESPEHRGGEACRLAPQSCSDYSGGWFMWVLRAAAASIGEYRSASAAEAYFRTLTDEIDSACDDGRLACTGRLAASLPPVDPAQWKTVPGRVGKAAQLLTWQGVGGGQPPSDTAAAGVGAMWRFVGRPPVRDPAEVLGTQVAGWFHDARPGWLAVRCTHPVLLVAVERQPSPDIALHFADPGAGMNRFRVAVPAIAGCGFEPTSGAGAVALAALAGAPAAAALGSGTLTVESVVEGIPPTAREQAWPRAVRHVIWSAYARVLPWLAGAGLLAFLWASWRAARNRRLEPLYLLAATAWCLVAARAALLVLVDLSAFAAIRVDYLQPAFALLVVASVASLSSSGSPRARRSAHPVARGKKWGSP